MSDHAQEPQGDETNPYQTPKSQQAISVSEIAQVQGDLFADLPSRWRRLGAYVFDAILNIVIYIPLLTILGLIDFTEFGDISNPRPALSYSERAARSAISIAIIVLLHGYFLATRGQSIGKLVLGIKIVRTDYGKASLSRILMLRVLPVHLVYLFPPLAFVGLIDALFIFRSDKRCLHDFIADTINVKA